MLEHRNGAGRRQWGRTKVDLLVADASSARGVLQVSAVVAPTALDLVHHVRQYAGKRRDADAHARQQHHVIVLKSSSIGHLVCLGGDEAAELCICFHAYRLQFIDAMHIVCTCPGDQGSMSDSVQCPS